MLGKRAIELGRLWADLMGRSTAEDTAAHAPSVDALFRRHGKDVVRIIRRLLGPRATAADVEDLTQQVFVSVQRDLPRFRGDAAVTTWLYGIASRIVFMHLRSGRRRTRAMEAFAEQSRAAVAQVATAEAEVARKQELDRVWRCLEKMKPKKRIVFVLFELEGLSGKEIAEALEVKEATVWTRLMHARRELVAELRKELGR